MTEPPVSEPLTGIIVADVAFFCNTEMVAGWLPDTGYSRRLTPGESRFHTIHSE